MSDVAIRVKGLSKKYRIGGKQEKYKTLRDTLAGSWTVLSSILHRNGPRRPNYEDIWALRDISFEVKRGEVLGVIGRNGAGKSTLLKILSRITEPTQGTVDIYGRVGSLLEVGTGFHPELTGRENVYLNGAILGMKRSEIDRKFDEMVAFAEVEKFIDTPVKHYSSGMYLRLAFAVAAHLDPQILVVDEVLAVGDAAFQKKCLGKMEDVAKAGRTVLFVSHNMGAVVRLCSTTVVLNNGEVEYKGNTPDAIDVYLSKTGERSSWTIQGGDNLHPFYLVSASVVDDHGRDHSRFPMGSMVTIELHTKVEKALTSSHLHVMVNYRGAVLLRTFDTDDHPELLELRPVGNYRYSLIFDTTWFKPGSYDVTVDLGIRPSTFIEKYVDIVSFELFDPKGDFDRGWSESRQGMIRAPAEWKVSFNEL